MFSSTIRITSSLAAFTLALTVAASADESLRLSTVAADSGFTYQWMPTEAGAMLARPGVRIVIRAGRLFYEVNNATPIADEAPRFDGRDLLISPRLAQHLRLIALKYPYPAVGSDDTSIPSPVSTGAASQTTASAMTLKAKQIPGRDALALQGTGPANVLVTITLTGEISNDLPIVVLSRKTIQTTTDGSFSAEVEYGQDSHLHTTIAAIATTLSGTSSAPARVSIGDISPQIKSSALDEWPTK